MGSQGRDSRDSGGARQESEQSGEQAAGGLRSDPRLARYLVRRRARSSAAAGGEAPREIMRAEQSTGAPLPEGLQQKFSASLGADLADVRVHTGSESAAAAESVGARAYTVGKNIHFGAGQYNPSERGGQELLAHEVAHTVQQSGTAHPQHKLEVGATDDPAEHEADDAAARMVDGSNAQVSAQEPALHRKPNKQLQADAKALREELLQLVDAAIWKEIRKEVYPKESAGNVKDAKDRKAGKKPDLTGLGQIKTLEHFAGAMKAVQKDWGGKTVAERLSVLAAAINTEMTSVGVPPFLSVVKEKTEAKGHFYSSTWQYRVSDVLVKDKKLDDADAEELCNVTIHEARHAEQAFLSARYSAGQGEDATSIADTQNIPQEIADKAVAQKFDGKTDAAVAAKGEEMHESMVTNKDKAQEIYDQFDELREEMKQLRWDARLAARWMKNPVQWKYDSSVIARDKLKAKMAELEAQYSLYRQIPHEADAHAVGDAGGEAFKGWK